MTNTPWAETLNQITPTGPIELKPAADERLDAFSVLAISLPPTYREFTRKLGAGVLSGWCEFFSCSPFVSTRWDMYYWNLNHLRFVLESGELADERAGQLVIFGRLCSGEDYGWDSQEITVKEGDNPREYAIYTVSRHMDRTEKVADTFPEFVNDFCMGNGLTDYLFFDQPNKPFNHNRNEFKPAK